GMDGEAVVLGGDLHLAGGHVLHRLVAAVMSELELVGAAAERESEDLVSEADAEHRHVAEQVGDDLSGAGHRVRVAGTVGQEHAVRTLGQDLAGGRRGGDGAPGGASGGQIAQGGVVGGGGGGGGTKRTGGGRR